MSEKVNIVGKVDAPSVIALVSVIALIWAMLNSFKSDIRSDIDRIESRMDRIEKKLDKLIDSKVVSSK